VGDGVWGVHFYRLAITNVPTRQWVECE